MKSKYQLLSTSGNKANSWREQYTDWLILAVPQTDPIYVKLSFTQLPL